MFNILSHSFGIYEDDQCSPLQAVASRLTLPNNFFSLVPSHSDQCIYSQCITSYAKIGNIHPGNHEVCQDIFIPKVIYERKLS